LIEQRLERPRYHFLLAVDFQECEQDLHANLLFLRRVGRLPEFFNLEMKATVLFGLLFEQSVDVLNHCIGLLASAALEQSEELGVRQETSFEY
jgi:hypothetical protein